MRVAYILEVFPKLSETFILNEILEAQRNGVEIGIFAFSKSGEGKAHSAVRFAPNPAYFKSVGFARKIRTHLRCLATKPICYLRSMRFAFKKKNCVRWIFASMLDDVNAIVNFHPDHIHAHFASSAADLAMFIHVYAGIPYTFTSHGYDVFRFPPENYVVKSNLAVKHITISKYNQKYLSESLNIAPDKIEVIHCGVDFTRRMPKINVRENRIVTIARISSEKGIDVLVQACAFLKEKEIQYECFIAGDGPEKSAIEAMIKAFKLESCISLLGAMTQDEVFNLLSSAALMVLPSRAEAMGVALMEAMMMGVPVIGPDLPGVRELVEDGQCGYMFTPGDSLMLAGKMQALIENRDIRERFGRSGYQKVHDQFNLQLEVKKLIHIWGNNPSQTAQDANRSNLKRNAGGGDNNDYDVS
jgi:glycosyltransferase involved in cell wall biosynthesis